MKKLIIVIVLSLSCLALLSCTTSTLVSSPYKSVRECKLSCEKRARACFNVCRNHCSQCLADRASRARENYCRYVNEQKVKGGPIALQLNSFSDPLQCRKVTCNCSADYAVCQQGCGGFIRKSLANTEHCG